MRIYAILLLYYPEYAGNAVARLTKILNLFNFEYKLLLVSNSQVCHELCPLVMMGDNKYWEFSGWSAGIDKLRTEYEFNEEDIFIFVNDTFAEHRYFGLIDEILFIKKIKNNFIKNNKSKPLLLGEYCNPIGDFTIHNCKQSGWISTYFFVMNYQLMSLLEKFYYDEEQLNDIVKSCGDDEVVFNSENVDFRFSKYINSWLYPKDNSSGWYKSKTSAALKYKKLTAILNEKRLSAICENNGGKLIDVYSDYAKIYKYLKNMINYRLRKFYKYIRG